MDPESDWLTLQAYLEIQLPEAAPQYWSILEQGLFARRAEARPCDITAVANSSVFDFLSSLRKPLGRHLTLFFRAGVHTPGDLNELCRVSDEVALDGISLAFMEAGLTPFEWLVVREGLRARVVALGL